MTQSEQIAITERGRDILHKALDTTPSADIRQAELTSYFTRIEATKRSDPDRQRAFIEDEIARLLNDDSFFSYWLMEADKNLNGNAFLWRLEACKSRYNISDLQGWLWAVGLKVHALQHDLHSLSTDSTDWTGLASELAPYFDATPGVLRSICQDQEHKLPSGAGKILWKGRKVDAARFCAFFGLSKGGFTSIFDGTEPSRQDIYHCKRDEYLQKRHIWQILARTSKCV